MGDQIKKASNSALKSIVESIVSEWNPLLIDVKSKKANVERTTDLVKQITSSFELFNAKQMQCKASMEQLSLSKVFVCIIIFVSNRFIPDGIILFVYGDEFYFDRNKFIIIIGFIIGVLVIASYTIS